MPRKKKSDVDTLNELKDVVDNKELSTVVQNAKISNPSKEVELALTDFLTKKLSRVEKDGEFSDFVKEAIMARIGEFDIDQLLQLNNQIARNNNAATGELSKLFVGDQSGKTVLNHLKDNSVATSAQIVYDNADKDILQSLTYFTSIMGKIANKQNQPLVEAKAEEVKTEE